MQLSCFIRAKKVHRCAKGHCQKQTAGEKEKCAGKAPGIVAAKNADKDTEQNVHKDVKKGEDKHADKGIGKGSDQGSEKGSDSELR